MLYLLCVIILLLQIATVVFLYRKMNGIAKIVSQFNLNKENNDIKDENFRLKLKHRDFEEFFEIILESLDSDTDWIRSTFFQRFGSMPDYELINSQIVNFQNRLNAIKQASREILNDSKKS